MGRKKRKVYYDRDEVLQSRAKKPNISARLAVEAVADGGKTIGNYRRLFCKKLFVDDPYYLDAMVMLNDICVLFPKVSLEVSAISFPVDLEEMSGRKKKGARKIKADTVICEMTTKDGQIISFKTPVGGQLLEYNDILPLNLDLLCNVSNGERYVAVIYPDTEIPSPNQSVEQWKVMQSAMSEKTNDCFSFLRTGNCRHGDKCKFSHMNGTKDNRVATCLEDIAPVCSDRVNDADEVSSTV